MNSSPWKIVGTSPRRIQPGILHRNLSIRILGHWIILILVVALSTTLLPWLQLWKARTARLQESYVLFPVFARDHGLDQGKAISRSQYSISANTSRRLLVFPFDLPPQNEKLPPWNPHLNAWQGPNGLYVPKHEDWCDARCGQLNANGDVTSSCKMNLCHFNASYGKEESIEGILSSDNIVLCNNSVAVDDTNYRLMKLIFGCVYKRRSIATGKRMKYEKELESDGVLGLNQLPLSFPSQLYERNMADKSIVLCLAKTKGVSAGYIVFGYPVRQMSEVVRWVPLGRGVGETYQVVLDNIKYGDSDIVMVGELLKRNFDIIIDGGSRFTYLDNAIFMAFVKIVKRWANADGFDFQGIESEKGTCWTFRKDSLRDAELRQRFRNVKFLLGGVKPRREMVVKPENYLISPVTVLGTDELQMAGGLVCLAIRSSDDIKQPGINILGGMAMKEHIFLMDRITDQFAWLEDETCERDRLVELRVTTTDHASGFRCNPFSGFCRV